MKLLLILSAAPSLISAYLMICRLNGRKWSALSPEAWAYLAFLGGAIYTFYIVFAYGLMPSLGKFMMDIAVCIYFGSRAIRMSRWLKRRLPNI